jgi:hypothetical protein
MQQGNFRYLITTHFDPRGAEAAKAAALEVKQTAEASNLAHRSGGKDLDGLTEKIGKATAAKARLRTSIQGAALQFPILGRFASAAINPMIGGIGLLVSGLTLAVKWVRELHRGLGDMVKVDVAAEMMAQGRALQEAELAARKYARELDRASQASISVADATKQIVDQIRAKATAEAEIADAQTGLEMAHVDEQERLGLISATEAIQQRAAIQDAADQRRLERELAVSKAIVAAREKELDQLLASEKKHAEQVARLRAQARALGSEDSFDRQIGVETERAADIRTARDRKAAAVSRVVGVGGGGMMAMSPLAAEVGTLNQKLAAVERRIKALRADELEFRDEIRATGEALAAGERELEGVRAARQNLERDLPGLRQEAESQRQTRSTVTELQLQTRQVETRTAVAVESAATASQVDANRADASSIVQAARSSSHPGSVMTEVVRLISEREQVEAGLLSAVVDELRRVYGNINMKHQEILRLIEQERARNDRMTSVQP